MMEAFLITNDLDGRRLPGCVVSTLKNLPERTFAKRTNNFVPVGQVIVLDNQVIATFVVIAVVVSRVAEGGRFLFAVGPDAVDRWIIQNLFAFVLRQINGLAALQEGCLWGVSSGDKA